MPVLPAFFRHTFRPTSVSGASKALSASWRKGLSSNTSARRNARLKASNDPYFLNRDYRELNELENGSQTNVVEIKGTTKTGEVTEAVPLHEHTVEDLHGDPSTHVIVSMSVQVESHPRGTED